MTNPGSVDPLAAVRAALAAAAEQLQTAVTSDTAVIADVEQQLSVLQLQVAGLNTQVQQLTADDLSDKDLLSKLQAELTNIDALIAALPPPPGG